MPEVGLASPRYERFLRLPIVVGGLWAFVPTTMATTLSIPMLDISHQCAAGRRNVTAMSECIVAESEARSEILQKWSRVPDASAERCLKVGKKSKRFPYSEISKCLSGTTLDASPSVVTVPPVVVESPGATPAAAAPSAGTQVATPPPITPSPAPSQGFSPAQSLRAFGSKLFGSGK